MNSPSLQKDAQELADFILYSQRSCMLKLSPQLSKEKLSYPQFFLLAYLAEEEGISMSNIAKMMGHSTAAATGMVDKLQDLRYLKRSTAAADRRKILVHITQRGKELVAQMRQNIADELATMLHEQASRPSIKSAKNILNKQKHIR